MDEQQKLVLNEIYQRNTLEWFALRQKFEQDVKYKEGKELLDWKRQECMELIKLLQKHKRELDWRAGEKVEPVAHFAEAVLHGTFGGEA